MAENKKNPKRKDIKPVEGASMESTIPPSGWLPEGENLSLGVTLGTCRESGVPVFQFNADRFRHTLILGRTGSGKSNLVQQMEREDIRSGAGVFILAAHEEDALYPLSCVPKERLGDVVLIDVSNPEYLPCLNPLDVDRGDRRAVDKAVNDVIELISMDSHATWTGPRFESLVRGGLGLLLEDAEETHCIADLQRLYTDPGYAKALLKHCESESLYDYWTKVVPDAMKSSDSGEVVAWFLSKVSRFANDSSLMAMFGPGRRTVDVQDVVDSGKILIAYVPESALGATTARTISRWLVMSLRSAIMNRRSGAGGRSGLDYGMFERRRADRPAKEPFFAYVDEFAKFACSDFEMLLSESRKQSVGFVLSTQTLSQTHTYDIRTDESGKLQETILGNVGTMICYPVGIRDADLLASAFDIDVSKVKSIECYRPLARLCIDNDIKRPITLEIGLRPAPDTPSAARRVVERHVQENVWLRVEEEDTLEGASPIWEPESLSFGSDLDDVDGIGADDMMDDLLYGFLNLPSPDELFNRTEEGFGLAFRYTDPKTGAAKLTPNIFDALDATMIDNAQYETVWACYKDGEIDHLASEREYQEELEERVTRRILESLPAAEIEEHYRIADTEKARQWLQEKKRDCQDIVESVRHEMEHGKVLSDEECAH